MTKVNFYRASLALPFLNGAVAAALNFAGIANDWLQFTILSMAFGGIPLLVTVLILLYISFRSTPDSFRTWWLGAPILMALVTGPCVMVVAGFTNFADTPTGMVGGVLGWWFMIGFFSLIVGYIYIAVTLALFFLLKWAGFIHNNQTVQS